MKEIAFISSISWLGPSVLTKRCICTMQTVGENGNDQPDATRVRVTASGPTQEVQYKTDQSSPRNIQQRPCRLSRDRPRGWASRAGPVDLSDQCPRWRIQPEVGRTMVSQNGQAPSDVDDAFCRFLGRRCQTAVTSRTKPSISNASPYCMSSLLVC